MGTDKDVKDSAQGLLSRPILVPLDGTDVAESILPYVSEVAKKGNVPLFLLGVVAPPGHSLPAYSNRPPGRGNFGTWRRWCGGRRSRVEACR